MRRHSDLPTHAFVPHMLGHRRSSSGLSSFTEELSPDFLFLSAASSDEVAEADEVLDDGPAEAVELTLGILAFRARFSAWRSSSTLMSASLSTWGWGRASLEAEKSFPLSRKLQISSTPFMVND